MPLGVRGWSEALLRGTVVMFVWVPLTPEHSTVVSLSIPVWLAAVSQRAGVVVMAAEARPQATSGPMVSVVPLT